MTTTSSQSQVKPQVHVSIGLLAINHNPSVYFTGMLTRELQGKLIMSSQTGPPLCTLGDREARIYWHGEAVQHSRDSGSLYLQLPPEMEYKRFSEGLNMTVTDTDI